MLTLKLAWRNLFRNARRTILTVLLIGFSLAAMILADGSIAGMTRSMIDTVTETLFGEVQVHHPGYLESYEAALYIEEGAEVLAEVLRDPNVAAAAPRVQAAGMMSSPYNVIGGQVLGVDADAELGVSKIAEAVIEGRYLSGERSEVLIGAELQQQLEVELGDRLVITLAESDSGELAQALFRISGVLDFNMKELNEGVVVVNLPELQRVLAMEGHYHQIVVQLVDRDLADDPAMSLYGMNSDSVEVVSWLDANPQISAILGMTTYSSLIVGTILFFLASLGVINSMFMSIFERLYELGVIKAVGTKPWQIMLLVILEAGLIGLLACAMGMALGGAAGYYFSIHGIPMGEIELEGINVGHIVTVVLPRHFIDFPVFVLVLTIVAALYPARFASRIVPALALKRTL